MRIKNENQDFMDELNFKENLILTSINIKNDSIFTKHLNLNLFNKSNNNFIYSPSHIVRNDLLNHITEIRNEWVNNFTPEQLKKLNQNNVSSDVQNLTKKISDKEIQSMDEIFDFFEKNPKGSKHMLYMFAFENSRKYISEKMVKFYTKYSQSELENIESALVSIQPKFRKPIRMDKLSKVLYPKPLIKEVSKINKAYLEYKMIEIKKLFDIADEHLSENHACEFKQNFFHRIKVNEFLNEIEMTLPDEFKEINEKFRKFFPYDLIRNNKLISKNEIKISKSIIKNENPHILISAENAFKQNSILRTLAENVLEIGDINVSFKKVSRKVFLLEIDLKEQKLTDKESFLNDVITILKNIEAEELDFINQRIQLQNRLSRLFETAFRKNQIEGILKDLNIDKKIKAKPKPKL